MKNKPTRHKETNTFQFKPFSERINEINVDVFHRVSHRNEVEEEEIETYFNQTLQKWNFLNLTEGYCSFKKLVRNIVTLPQLVNEKQFVIDNLIEYLKKKDVLFLQPILELVVAVAKDLQKDFYEYFPRFLSVIIDLLHTKDIEQIEYAFTSLAYLFKFLWRYLVKNINTVFDLLLPLLADTQPVYINNFAAESFSFVVRKVKDKNHFLKSVLETLEDKPNGVSGCGKLLFEVVSGTPGQFHSCAEQMLPIYFNALNEDSINQKIAYNVLKQVVTCITQNIHPQKSTVLWNVLLNTIDATMAKTDTTETTTDRQPSLALLMLLIIDIIEYKNGRLLIEPVPIIKKLIRAIEMFKEREEVLREVLKVAIAILLASHIKLMQETSSQILLKIMAIQNSKLLYTTVEKLIDYSSFETLVLPHILKHCVLTGFDDNVLELLAKIIKAKAPPSCNGRDLNKWKKYILDIRGVQPESINYLIEQLKSLSSSTSSSALKVLMIIPHLKPLTNQFKNLLKEVLVSVHQKIIEQVEQKEDLDKLCITLLFSLESAIHVLDAEDIRNYLSVNNCNMLDLAYKYPNNKIILNTIDLYMTYFAETQFQDEYINESVFASLNESIGHELSSPFSETRWIVTHLYSLFNGVKEITSSTANNGKSALDLMYLAESETVSVQNFRDKLLYMQSLTYENSLICDLNSKFHDVPLRYLLGNLYVNFSLVWEPVTKIIATYATKECEQFWPVFLSALSHTAESGDYKPLFECEILSELEDEIRKSTDNPDYNNYKILLWKCMAHFSQFCEAKNRDLTGLFIDFVNENFFKMNSEDAKCCSITKTDEIVITENADDEMQIDESDDEEEKTDENKTDQKIEELQKQAVPQKDRKKKSSADQKHPTLFKRINKVKLLIAQLQIFERIVNPRTLYREPEVQKIYLDLLCSKNLEIQKAALNCLLTYKYKYLLPYKENLHSLISEKNFKNELARFRIDTESNMIQEEHRDEFIPILMRIIYSKMVVKTGMRTGGKAGGHVRRKMILRFLAGTEENEMIIFTKMAFKPFNKYLPLEQSENVNLKDITRNLMDTIDLNDVIPPKRLQSTVNLLSILIEQFGSKMIKRLLPYLLGLIICILAEITAILQRSDQVHPRYLTSIKTIRTNCISILARFFEHFEEYPWKEHEINALFDVAVFPWLEKLPIEGIHSPTALLKLFVSWSQNSRYYPLFIKYREDNKSLTPLPFIMRLLLGPKTHQSVTNAILSMIEKMVTLQDYGRIVDAENEMQVDTVFLPMEPLLNNLLDVRQDMLDNGVNYGSTILLPHVFDVLEYIKNKLKATNRGMSKTELVILSRISEFVTDGEVCDVILSLTLPILTKRAAVGESEETILELLTTAVNLVKRVKRPEIHIRGITPLLGAVSSTAARKLLIQLYSMIADGSAEECRERLKQNCNLLIALNAWDSRWIDQPDFQKRLDAFSEVNGMAEKGELALDFGVAIVYNCFYFLKNDSDLAMKDFAGQCLKSICPKLAKQYKDNPQDRRYFMDDTIFAILKRGIVHKTEAVRLQSIGLLGHMAIECPEVHVVLRDLSLLTNKQDPEVDFFENMQHLQLHRKSRALLKFCTVAKTLKKAFNPRTMTQFILPLASTYLCNETFAHKNNMVDSAIDVIGTICKLLPWHQYEVILKYYLVKLRSNVEYQKQLVRIIVAILDAFHYDLSKFNQSEIAKESANLLKKAEAAVDNEEKKDSAITEEVAEVDKEEENETEEAEEKLDEALNNETADNVEEIVEKGQEKVEEDTPILEKQIVLSQSGARRIVFSISRGLLPQLHRAITARTRHESSHKVNKKLTASENEDEELMRVPIALALVKLLQKLPEDVLEANLPGIFMKLCTFLKSRLDSVRRATREILQKIMVTLGPKYLHHLLKEMNTLLTKGFQVHVLAYTVQSVLVVLKPYFQKLDINNNLQSILSVCKVDLFGLTSEEKEVIGIIKTVSEARVTKSYDIFHILAQFITESCLLDLILPLKEVLGRTHSHKTVHKVSECLRNIVLGLTENTFISLHQMLIFTYGIISESIPELLPDKAKKLNTKQARVLTQSKTDCYIIAPEPKNQMGIKAVAKTSKNTNAHVVTEFGLKLCLVFLKRDKISSDDFKPFIDPFVPILADCLKSQHVKLSALALQCLTWLLRMDLSSIQDLTSDITSSIFDILHKYAAAGLSKGENFDLVVAAFKCVAVIVRDVRHFSLTAEQLELLVIYAEQDLHDSEKQATAFRLLKAVIGRKIDIPEIHPVMEKVASLSITSELEHVKQQSRSVFYSYLMEYPLGKSLDKHISFYLTQLSYELQPGRMSALEMMHSIITGFPLKALLLRSDLILLMMGVRLINDDDPNCRKLCAKCIKEMITRVPYNKRSKLFDIVLEWLKDYKMTHRTLAAQLCGIFVTVEKDKFESRIEEILPVILKQFHENTADENVPGRFVRVRTETLDKKVIGSKIKDPERLRDHHFFQVLQLLLKISAHCPSFLKSPTHKDSIRMIAEHCQYLLGHPHVWVRLASSQMLGFVLATLDVERVISLLQNPQPSDTEDGYIYFDTEGTLKSLTLDLIAQLQPDMTFEELADQVVKNLIFIAKILKSNKIAKAEKTDKGDGEKGKDPNELTLLWLVRRIRKVVNIEVTQSPKSTTVRTAVFKWIAGVVATIPIDDLQEVLFSVMSPLVREMSNMEDTNKPLRRLAKEAATMIKKNLGAQEYAKLLSKVQQRLDVRKAERRKLRTQQFITDPELTAKRKIARQQKKKEAKKRKLETVRGKKSFRKRPRQEVDLEII